MTKNKLSSTKALKFCAFALLATGFVTTTGCTSRPLAKTEIAKRIASPAWMLKREIPASPFLLTAYERIHEYKSDANLYIGGNGDTPLNPVALHLASKDNAKNVIYIARPCQYSGMLDESADCNYTGDNQYNAEVIEAYNIALDEISARYQVRSFNLIGYDGGAVIAANLGATRNDIASIRTVAGIMDTDAMDGLNPEKPATYTPQNPSLIASEITEIPQYHFIGGQDKVVPPSVLHSYLQSVPPTRCIQYEMIQENEHSEGWVQKWPELLERPVTCYHGKANTFNVLDMMPREDRPAIPAHPVMGEKPVKP